MAGEETWRAGIVRKEECMEGQVKRLVGQGTWKEAWGSRQRGGLGRLPGCGEANQPGAAATKLLSEAPGVR